MTLNPDAPTTEREIRFARLQIPRWMLISFAILGQIIVSLAINEIRLLGFVQVVVIIIVAVYGAVRRDLATVICTITYLTGAEVVWRQTNAPIFYLTAPYLVIGLSLFSVLLVLRRLGRDARLAALYGLLLLPAAAATIRTTGGGSRQLIAFALSGPLALATFVMVTSQVTIARWLYRRMLWVILVSSVGPLSIAMSDMRADLAHAAITFTTQSNFATSGGFGPVQVSAALSMGMMAAVLLIIIEVERITRIIAALLTVALGVQTLLTFSRGGSFSFGIALTVFAITQSRNRRIRNRIILIASITFALAYFVIFPRLESFTGGMFQQRFSNTETGRTELAANDIDIFRHNFMFGVGPGMTKYQRLTYAICQIRSDKCANEASSHTEFTRTLSEHGIPGVIAIVILLTLAWHAYRRAGPGRAFAVAWIAWAIAQMFYANLRIVAVPVAFGIAFLRFDDRSPPTEDEIEPGGDSTPGPADRTAATGRTAWQGRSLQTMGRDVAIMNGGRDGSPAPLR